MTGPPKSVELWVRDLSGLDEIQRLMLYTLSTYRHRKSGRCNPSMATLATVLGRSERTIGRRIKKLADLGVISTHLGRHTLQIDFNFQWAHPDSIVSDSDAAHSDTHMSESEEGHSDTYMSDSPGESLGHSEQVTRTFEGGHSDKAVSDKPLNPEEPYTPPNPPRGVGRNQSTRRRSLEEDLNDTSWAEG